MSNEISDAVVAIPPNPARYRTRTLNPHRRREAATRLRHREAAGRGDPCRWGHGLLRCVRNDPQEVTARAKALSVKLDTLIAPGFEALVFQGSRAIDDIYDLTYVRKDGSRFPAISSLTALRIATRTASTSTST